MFDFFLASAILLFLAVCPEEMHFFIFSIFFLQIWTFLDIVKKNLGQ